MVATILECVLFTLSFVNMITRSACGGFASGIVAGHICAVVDDGDGARLIASTAMVNVIGVIMAFVVALR